MLNEFPLARVAKAGALTGFALYFICLAYYLLVLSGEGQWMLEPFMPGAAITGSGLIWGLFWSLVYGAGIPWLWGFFFNATGASKMRVEQP